MFDVTAFYKAYRITYSTNHKSVSSGWVGVNCPFCGDGEGFHLGYNLSKGYFTCWKCGFQHKKQVIQRLVRCTDREAREIESTYNGKPVLGTPHKSQQSTVQYVQIPDDRLNLKERKYLSDRGFDADYLERAYNLRSGGFAGYWKYRIVIPIQDQTGRIVSVTGRATISKMEPRYKTSPNNQSIVPAKDTLFGMHMIKQDQRKVIVVEGPIDQFRIGPGSVATYGVDVTNVQVSTLVQTFDHVTVMFDGDDAGRRGADRLAEALSVVGVSYVEVMDLPSGVEPDTWDEQERLIFLENYWR